MNIILSVVTPIEVLKVFKIGSKGVIAITYVRVPRVQDLIVGYIRNVEVVYSPWGVTFRYLFLFFRF